MTLKALNREYCVGHRYLSGLPRRPQPAPLTSRRLNQTCAMSDNKDNNQDPEDYHYTHLWVSTDGETHITEAKMEGFDLKKYAADSQAQFVKPGPGPSKVVFTELAPGLENDYHPAPAVQFVITTAGSWKIKATDGSEKVFVPGDILFQDDTEQSPAQKTPKHWSGVVGDKPNQQVIIQVDCTPEVDKPGCL
eukprot:GHRR01006013.1.p1 GENE.GHRR01006013.1~~GHRR01006013.1.p1  ORF type:complete len:192 (+),score=44.92 GHRR01006013.1:201-776(+)